MKESAIFTPRKKRPARKTFTQCEARYFTAELSIAAIIRIIIALYILTYIFRQEKYTFSKSPGRVNLAKA